ncbi:hypothetical protein [Clostridium chromiireducens]|nr:hypothetical protein [Clostridium chromiireducens]
MEICIKDHMEFLEWAAAYDNGDIDMRSKAKHDEWRKCSSVMR